MIQSIFPQFIVQSGAHHMGITLITIAFVYLLGHVLSGHQIHVPPIFFYLYSAGGFLIMYEMQFGQRRQVVSLLELIGACVAAYLGYLMTMQRK